MRCLPRRWPWPEQRVHGEASAVDGKVLRIYKGDNIKINAVDKAGKVHAKSCYCFEIYLCPHSQET